MEQRELQDKIVCNMKRWQRIEDRAAATTGAVMETTDNPLVRLIMEIIQRDSQMHHRVQELIAEVTGGKAVSLSPEELGEVWGLVEEHNELEQRALAMAEEALTALKGTEMVVQQYLLGYLLNDEKKHNDLRESLGTVKQGMYPYG